MEYRDYLKSPVGILEIVADSKNILAIKFSSKIKTTKGNALTKKCVVQLEEYFAGKRKKFFIPYEFAGTKFQNKVYQCLAEVAYGKLVSYGELAKMIARPKAARAVGQAINKNKLAIIMPCHRVIGSSGELVGYSGGIKRKKYLLNLENSDNL